MLTQPMSILVDCIYAIVIMDRSRKDLTADLTTFASMLTNVTQVQVSITPVMSMRIALIITAYISVTISSAGNLNDGQYDTVCVDVD